MATHQSAARNAPCVGVIMGSKSDLKHLQPAIDLLIELDVPHEAKIVSAHLPGMVAAKTVLPVLGVPVPATTLNGLDSLLSIVQMPKGVPVGTLAIGEPGAVNAALLATSIVSTQRPELRERLRAWRARRTEDVLAHTDLTTL